LVFLSLPLARPFVFCLPAMKENLS
jgi:hypothetical protein